MRAEIVTLAEGPEAVLDSGADCLWLWISPRSAPGPLAGVTMQKIDWDLQGLLSRYLFDQGYGSARHTTFLPSMKRLKIPYVAIDCQKSFDMERFLGNVEGLQLQTVFCLCETTEQVEFFKKAVSKLKTGAFLKKIMVGLDVDALDAAPGTPS